MSGASGKIRALAVCDVGGVRACVCFSVVDNLLNDSSLFLSSDPSITR